MSAACWIRPAVLLIVFFANWVLKVLSCIWCQLDIPPTSRLEAPPMMAPMIPLSPMHLRSQPLQGVSCVFCMNPGKSYSEAIRLVSVDKAAVPAAHCAEVMPKDASKPGGGSYPAAALSPPASPPMAVSQPFFESFSIRLRQLWFHPNASPRCRTAD